MYLDHVPRYVNIKELLGGSLHTNSGAEQLVILNTRNPLETFGLPPTRLTPSSSFPPPPSSSSSYPPCVHPPPPPLSPSPHLYDHHHHYALPFLYLLFHYTILPYVLDNARQIDDSIES